MSKLVLAGIALVVVGIGLLAYGLGGQGNVSSGGFILIGPFPIVFGSGSSGGELALLSVILGVVMLVLLLVMGFRFKSLTREGGEETDK